MKIYELVENIEEITEITALAKGGKVNLNTPLFVATAPEVEKNIDEIVKTYEDDFIVYDRVEEFIQSIFVDTSITAEIEGRKICVGVYNDEVIDLIEKDIKELEEKLLTCNCIMDEIYDYLDLKVKSAMKNMFLYAIEKIDTLELS